MAVAFYMDEHVPRAITEGLRLRGVDVPTAQEDGAAGTPDDELLGRATALGRVLFSQDDDMLRAATACQTCHRRFVGVIYIHQLLTSIGPVIDDMELISMADDVATWESRVEYLPLR